MELHCLWYWASCTLGISEGPKLDAWEPQSVTSANHQQFVKMSDFLKWKILYIVTFSATRWDTWDDSLWCWWRCWSFNGYSFYAKHHQVTLMMKVLVISVTNNTPQIKVSDIISHMALNTISGVTLPFGCRFAYLMSKQGFTRDGLKVDNPYSLFFLSCTYIWVVWCGWTKKSKWTFKIF